MRIRILSAALGVVVSIGGCGGDSDGAAAPASSSFVSDQRIIYSDGLHNENTEMIKLGNRILLVFRGGEEGQMGSARARIKVFESVDNGRSFTLLSEVDAAGLTGGRDIRDPKLVSMNGTLFLYAISRVPGFHYRDLFGQAWTVRSESTDSGRTWTAPVKTYEDVKPSGLENFWGFWRFTKRRYQESGQTKETLFATAYDDGDTTVALFASEDGIHWERRGTIIRQYDDVPSEAELQFFGTNDEKAVSLVRLDNQDIVADGQTAICTSSAPFVTWECGRRIEQRLDGPSWIVDQDAGHVRSFVFARKHLPCTFKRTAIYELRGDLTDPSAPVEVCEIQEVKSSGDTAYTSIVPVSKKRYLLAWYSSPVDREPPWLEGQFEPSDIWLADVDLQAAPATCTHPAPKRACQSPPLPTGTTLFDVTGEHLLTFAPVIWPTQTVSFRADVAVHGSRLDFSLQPLDGNSKAPVGEPWSVTDIALASDGSFSANFGTQPVPPGAYPLIDDPFLMVGDLVVTGKTISPDVFCGYFTGYAQVLPVRVSDRIRFEGSTFGARRITGDTLPEPLSACPSA